MPVIATQRGYYAGRIIEPGDPVPLAEGDPLASWMEAVDEPAEPAKGKSKGKAQTAPSDVKPPAEPAKGTDPVTGDEI